MTTITGTAILGLRGTMLIQAIKTYLRTNGEMQLTRVATPANMRAIATEFTGKKYARSRKGLETALADMIALRDNAGSLSALGDVAVVNKEVGGVASALQPE